MGRFDKERLTVSAIDCTCSVCGKPIYKGNTVWVDPKEKKAIMLKSVSIVKRMRRKSKDNQTKKKPDTFCYGCMVDTNNLECSPYSGCFIGKEKWKQLNNRKYDKS